MFDTFLQPRVAREEISISNGSFWYSRIHTENTETTYAIWTHLLQAFLYIRTDDAGCCTHSISSSKRRERYSLFGGFIQITTVSHIVWNMLRRFRGLRIDDQESSRMTLSFCFSLGYFCCCCCFGSIRLLPEHRLNDQKPNTILIAKYQTTGWSWATI